MKKILWLILVTCFFLGSSFTANKKDIRYYLYAILYTDNSKKIYFSSIFYMDQTASYEVVRDWAQAKFIANQVGDKQAKVIIRPAVSVNNFTDKSKVSMSRAFEMNKFEEEGYTVKTILFPAEITFPDF